MSDTKNLIELYSKRILKLASQIPLTAPIENPQATSKKHSPLCGSTVEVALRLSEGRISAYSQNVRACALGQASASILGQHVIGLDRDQIETARDQLWAMLTQGGPTPQPPFEDLEILRSAQEYRNRHASILLAFEATLEAIDTIEKKSAH